MSTIALCEKWAGLLNAGAKRDVHCYKEERYGRNNFNRRLGFAVDRCTAHVASQSKVGLLSQWRAWLDPFDFDHPAAVGSVLGGREALCPMQMMVQDVSYIEWRA
jgi:hypothetical protein